MATLLANPETKRSLTTAEKSRFRKLDKAVQAGIGAFIVVGMALREIRDNELYVEEFESFAEYVRDRHEMSKSRAYQLIDAADTVNCIEASNNVAHLPANDRQALALAALPLDQRASAWEEVVQRAEESGEKITAKFIEKIVATATPHARRTPAKMTAEALDKKIEKLHAAFRDLPSRKLKEAFVEKLHTLVTELEEWLEQ